MVLRAASVPLIWSVRLALYFWLPVADEAAHFVDQLLRVAWPASEKKVVNADGQQRKLGRIGRYQRCLEAVCFIRQKMGGTPHCGVRKFVSRVAIGKPPASYLRVDRRLFVAAG